MKIACIGEAMVELSLEDSDVALPSDDDEMAIFGDADTDAILKRFCTYGVGAGALKRGPAGPVPISEPVDTKVAFAPAPKVVDTTAAGDSFGGVFLASFLTGGSLTDAMVAGHKCASAVIGHRGAIARHLK